MDLCSSQYDYVILVALITTSLFTNHHPVGDFGWALGTRLTRPFSLCELGGVRAQDYSLLFCTASSGKLGGTWE